jgi:hypothetical protein
MKCPKFKIFCATFLSFSCINLSITQTCVNPVFFNNQLDVSYNQVSNNVSIGGLACDPCVIGGVSQSLIDNCECHNNCADQLIACYNLCSETSTNISELIECINLCDIQDSPCKQACPSEEITRLRTPVNYKYNLTFWWTTGCVGTNTGPPNQNTTSPWISGSPPDPITIPLVDNLTMTSVAYCYSTTVQIIYDDGSCCMFFDFACFDIC